MFRRRALRCALGLAALLSGCRQSVQGCLDLVSAQKYQPAARRCAAVFAASGDPRAGAAVVRAHYFLGHEREALAWADRLEKAGKAAPGVWSVVGLVDQRRGEAGAAERAYRRDLAICRAAGDHGRAADALYRLFNLSWHRSSYRETFLIASEAVQEASRAGDRAREARAAEALYTSLFEVGDLAGARQALERADGLIPEQERGERARFLNNRGTVLAAERRLGLARHDFEQALSLGAGNEPEFSRGVLMDLTEVSLEGDDVERADLYLKQAWEHLEPGRKPPPSLFYYRSWVDQARGRLAEAAEDLAPVLHADLDSEWGWKVAYQQGRVAEARSDLRAAEEAYERSIAILEEMRRGLAFDELKSWLLEEERRPFEALFRLQARSGRAAASLATMERAQARTFLDAFVYTTSESPLAGKAWTPDAAGERLAALESLLPAMSESPVAALQPVDRVLSALRDRDGLLYFEAGDELWLITVRGPRLQLRKLAAPTAEIRDLADRFLGHPDDVSLAGRLGEILLPAGALPEAGQPVYVVADGVLGNLPFAALRRQGRFLVEDHGIVFVPSLNALAALEAPRAGSVQPAVALADPRRDLPAAAAEAAEVAHRLNGTAWIAGEATAPRLQQAAHSRTLHLATHTGLGPRGAWLQLADRRVTASEIVAGRIGPRLVVLASCASGARPGREMWGSLGASFLAAGSRAVLASLWSIEDRPTRELVRRFYAEGGDADPCAALARVQRVAIRQGLSPHLWAAFVLFGSERPLNESVKRR
ncbi:MAG TPA: CHAT domain-containing protein [Thermoanaerobaculia bacterium]|jgi:tetratricopeptide (TPR) repeat protein